MTAPDGGTVAAEAGLDATGGFGMEGGADGTVPGGFTGAGTTGGGVIPGGLSGEGGATGRTDIPGGLSGAGAEGGAGAAGAPGMPVVPGTPMARGLGGSFSDGSFTGASVAGDGDGFSEEESLTGKNC